MKTETILTLAEAIALYPQLNSEPVQMMDYPIDGFYPSWATFQFIGDNNYRTRRVSKFDRHWRRV